MVSEMSYIEIGTEDFGFAIGLMPGELAPELAWGGTMKADTAWNGVDFEHEPMANEVGYRQLIICSQANDAIGYILPDNDYGPGLRTAIMRRPSLGSQHRFNTVKIFAELVASTKA